MYKALREFVLLDPEKIMLHRDRSRGDRLCLTVWGSDGEEMRAYQGVSVRRAFPISGADELITFVDRDNNELGFLMDVKGLDPQSLATLREELDLAYFVPQITRILELKEEFGLMRWEVETDRGPRQFETASRYDVRHMGGKRYVIRDLDGNRYEIPDLDQLDTQSRLKIDMEL